MSDSDKANPRRAKRVVLGTCEREKLSLSFAMQSEGFERLSQIGLLGSGTRWQWLRRGMMGAAGAFSGAGGMGYAWGIERHRLVVEENELRVRGLAEGWVGARVVHLSDMHLEPWTKEAH